MEIYYDCRRYYAIILREFLNEFDFSYEIDEDKEGNKVYHLIDKQHANLGDVEEEDYYSIEQMVDRLDIYYHDYIYKDICEEYGYDGYEDYESILEWLNANKNTYNRDVIEVVECIVFPKKIKEK